MGKRPILILAQRAGRISEALRDGLIECGEDVELEVYDEKVFSTRKTLVDRLMHRILDPGYQNDLEFSFNDAILRRSGKLKQGFYRAVILMKGNYLHYECRNILTKIKAPIIVWAYDSVCRAPMQVDAMSIADHIYCLEDGDVRDYLGRSSWLPLGYNSMIFDRKEKPKDIDVFMSGAIGPLYKRRRDFLTRLGCSRIAKSRKCVFVGTTGFKLKDLLVNVGNISWAATHLPAEELADYQARAKICVNIHQDDGLRPVNLSFFSIPGSGSCQLAEKKAHLKLCLNPGKEYEEFADDEYLEKIEMLLQDDKLRMYITDQGYKRVRENYTMACRAEQIMRKIGELEAAHNLAGF